MIVDKFTKFILSIIAIFLCLNALNPWLSPPLVNAEPLHAPPPPIQQLSQFFPPPPDFEEFL